MTGGKRDVLSVQKLAALSASLARVVSTAEEEDAQLDAFPTEEARHVWNFYICFYYT